MYIACVFRVHAVCVPCTRRVCSAWDLEVRDLERMQAVWKIAGEEECKGLTMNWNILSLIPLAYAMETFFNYVFIWCGMSIIAGAVAKLLVPGDALRGTAASFLTGFISMTISAFLMKFFYFQVLKAEEFNPFHPFVLLTAILIGAVGVFICRYCSSIFSKKS